MKKIFTSLILTASVFLLFSSRVDALTISPSNGTFPVSGNKTVSILANSTDPATAMQLRLTINNAKVVSFSGPGGNLLSIGVCDASGGTYRSISSTKYEVCVDIASTSGPITNGSPLGTITLASLSSAGGEFTIEGNSDNGYLVGSTLEAVSGVLGSYAFGTATAATNNVTVLPNTALSDYMPNRGILGAAILISGVVSLAVAVKIFLLDKRKDLL